MAEARTFVQYRTRRRGVPHPRSIRRWTQAALGNERRRGGELTVRFVGAREGRALNRRWRGRDCATNVLSFPGEAASDVVAWLGDVVLCVPVILAEARAQHKPANAHYAHMVVHGVLHLLGYDHLRVADAVVMERRETSILRSLGYPDPYGSG
ncbi:MAG: rRNA maturation RNase YbeY [Gammaproteobacteria bacterium]|nr:rRNA maturation RNase YbeY [Gammaproteobacteria bacterium]